MRRVLGLIYWTIVWMLIWIIFPFNWLIYKLLNVDLCPEFWFMDIADWLEYKEIIK